MVETYSKKYMIKIIVAFILLMLSYVMLFMYIAGRDFLIEVPKIMNTIDEDFTIEPLNYSTLFIRPKLHIPKQIYLLVLISSSPHDDDHREKRHAIRNTWGNCKNLHALYEESKYIPSAIKCKVVFFLGRPANDSAIISEAESNNDMLVANYEDTYGSITRKLLIAFEWADSYKPRYILKTDDDVFIHIPRLIRNILLNSNHLRYYGGVLYSGRVVRDKRHRHYISEDVYDKPRFPAFCKGALYVFSGKLLPPLIFMSEKVKRFGVDDAYVGVLMNTLKVIPVNIETFITIEFKMFLDILNDCVLAKLIGISDGLSSKMILHIHERMKYMDECKLFYPCVHMSSHAMLLGVAFILAIYMIFHYWKL